MPSVSPEHLSVGGVPTADWEEKGTWLALQHCLWGQLWTLQVEMTSRQLESRAGVVKLWLQTKPCPPFVWANKVLLEHSHTHGLHIVRGCLGTLRAELSRCGRPCGPQSLKCLLSSLLQGSLPTPSQSLWKHLG